MRLLGDLTCGVVFQIRGMSDKLWLSNVREWHLGSLGCEPAYIDGKQYAWPGSQILTEEVGLV